MTALLELRDIRRSYPSGDGSVEVLKGITLTSKTKACLANRPVAPAGRKRVRMVQPLLSLYII
ncbi:hypothetical protein CQA86_07640, partial [Klebsiella pneumoniae]